MARPKGSKNAVRTKKAKIDYVALIAEKTTAKEQIETEIAALSDNISVLKEQLKSKKSALKVAVKELSKAEAKRLQPKKGRRRIQKGRSGIRIEKAACQRYVCR